MAGNIRLYNTSGYVELQAPSSASAQVLELPTDSIQPGLVHLHTESFLAVSSVSIDNLFTASYERYLLVGSTTASTGSFLRFRMRASGTDDSGTNYRVAVFYNDSTGSTGNSAGTTNAGTSGSLGSQTTGGGNFVSVISGAYESAPTIVQSVSSMYLAGSLVQRHDVASAHNLTNSYDGISLISGAGTISGTLSIYGYRNS